MGLRLLFLLLAGTAGRAPTVDAQQQPAASPPATPATPATEALPTTREVRDRGTQKLLSTAPVEGAVLGTATRAYLQADNGNSLATVSTGFDLTSDSWVNLGLRLQATTPLSKDDKEVSLLDYRRLGDGTEVSLTLQGLRFGRARPRAVNGVVEERTGRRLIQWCRDRKAEGKLAETIDCTDFDSAQLDDAPRALYLDFLRTAGWRSPWTFEIGGRVQRNEMAYLDAATFAPASLDRTSYGFSGNLGQTFAILGPLSSGLFALGYEYAVRYDEGGSGDVCTPAGPTGGLRCRTGKLGAPERALSSAVTAELRAFVGTRFGFSAQAAYLTRAKEWNISVPLYFLPNESGALIGGIAPSYTTESSKWGVRLFVGATGFGRFRVP